VKIAVFCSLKSSVSIGGAIYRSHLLEALAGFGVQTECFSEHDPVPLDVDLYWDPNVMGGGSPYRGFARSPHPYVVTLHDVLTFTVPATERTYGLRAVLWSEVKNTKKRYNWRRIRDQIAAVITGSEFVKREAVRHFRLDAQRIFPIPYGVDLDTFHPADVSVSIGEPYFFHISNGRPTKNVTRLIEAYQRLPPINRPRLVLRIPADAGISKELLSGAGIEVITNRLDDAEVARLYQGALGFAFPSLHEGYGLPILEAMACGCPVITSGVTSCPEVAGDAALLVDPRSVDDITAALGRLSTDNTLRRTLRERGMARAATFTWERSAQDHLRVFRWAATHSE
jgi:glycosyltransferase involved in cell wall biosynthesis